MKGIGNFLYYLYSLLLKNFSKIKSLLLNDNILTIFKCRSIKDQAV